MYAEFRWRQTILHRSGVRNCAIACIEWWGDMPGWSDLVEDTTASRRRHPKAPCGDSRLCPQTIRKKSEERRVSWLGVCVDATTGHNLDKQMLDVSETCAGRRTWKRGRYVQCTTKSARS